MREVIRSSKRIRRRRNLTIFSVLLCVFLIFFDLSGYLSQLDRFLIKEVDISGNNIIKKSDIYSIVKEKLSGRYLHMFPRNNFLLYPRKAIEKQLTDKFLRIENIEVENIGIEKLKITIEERKPKFVWCPRSNSDCYYLDSKGLVFEQAPDFSEGVFFRWEGGLLATEKAESFIGKNLIETDKLNKLINFKDEAEDIIKKNLGKEWFASSISIMDWEDFSIKFSNLKNRSWKIMFVGKGIERVTSVAEAEIGVLKTKEEMGNLSLESNLINTARNLEATVTSEDFKASFNKKNSIIDYIDLRFGKKIFYKFISGNVNSSTSTPVL